MSKFFSKFRSGLTRTRSNLVDGISKAVSGKTKLDEETLEQIEELLIAADVGVERTFEIIESLQKRIRLKERQDLDAVFSCLKEEMVERLVEDFEEKKNGKNDSSTPKVVLVTGVNGVGKTTTIGKLAHLNAQDGKKVVLGAADTFRAAASAQLEIWAERAGVDIVRNKPGADPAAVAFDAVTAAVQRKADIALIDTAGRLHTKTNLMEELKKIRRSVSRVIPDAPHETLLVLDATTGQNGLSQAKVFNEAVELTGVVLTKLDGTAKGGIVVAIHETLGLPIKYVGVGEQIDDLQSFDAEEYVEALFA